MEGEKRRRGREGDEGEGKVSKGRERKIKE